MKKSFKKVIAVLLAVLMVAFSVPFTAFAAPGDYNPDIDVMFGTFHHAEATSWTDYSTGSGKDYSMCGLYDVPVDFNATLTNGGLTKSGTLYIDAAKSAKAAAVVGYQPLAENYTLGVGDYFTCSVVIKNIQTIGAMQAYVQYSDNIEPAGYYSYKDGRKTAYKVGTVSECAAANGTFAFGGTTPITAMSSEGIYGMNVGATGNATFLGSNGSGEHFIGVQESCQNGGDCIDVSTAYDQYYADPNTGELNGYTYSGVAILETFVFKITGAGDIAFSVYDPYNTKEKAYSGAFYIATAADGAMNRQYTTYATNTTDSVDGSENPGSRKMTFFGKNVNNTTEEPACTHANVTATPAKDATCTEAGNSAYWTCNDCSKMFSDEACKTEITEVPTIPATGHSLEETAAKGATCTEAGNSAYWTCSVCGKMYADANGATEITEVPTISATGHSLSEVKEVPSTCTVKGTAAYWTCTACGKMFSNAEGTTEISAPVELPLADHNYNMVKTEATCTEASSEVYTCSACGDTYTTHVDPAKGHTAVSANNAVAATCTTDGKEADTVCSVCGITLATGATIPSPGHNYSMVKTDATCTEASTEVYTCSVCGDTYTTHVDPALGHDFSVVVSSTAGDCQTIGTTTYKCSRCDATDTVSGAYGPHTEVEIPAVDPTCTEAGSTAGTKCSVCGEIIVAPTPVDALGHTPVSADNAVAATCTTDGKEADTVCSVCGVTLATGATIPATGHTPVSADNAVAPTLDAPGKEADTVCSVCGVTLEEGAVIPALEGVNITVKATDLGTTAINGEDATNGATVKVLKNSKVALTAAPVEGAEFVGWALNGKIVSESANTTVTALADATYTAVFTETAAAAFTVVFVDNYGNVISTQTVADASEIVAPTAPTRPGYTFKGWSVDYTTLTTGATIYAQFEKDAAATYTVTATGCTITTAAGATATDVMTDVAYDTSVTITANSGTASSWKIGDSTVAFGESYTFYVGSDVTVVPQFDSAVTAKPTVTAVNVSDVVQNGKTRAVFLATRSMTDDCTYIGSGYIYGKAADVTADTTLADVNGTSIRRLDNKTASEQFSVICGIGSQTGSLAAKAYLAYVDGNGDTQVIYADLQTYTYA